MEGYRISESREGSKTTAQDGHAARVRTLYRGSAGAFAVQVVGAGFAFGVQVVLARLLGVSQYGIYTLALTWITILSTAALFGQSTAVLRFVPSYIHQKRWSQLRGLRRGVCGLVVVTGALIALAGAVVVYLFRERLGRKLELTMLFGFALLPLMSLLLLSGALHQSLRRAVSARAFYRLIRPPVLLGLALGFNWLYPAKFSAPIVMLCGFASIFVALSLSEHSLSRAWPHAAKHVRPVYETAAWLQLGRQVFLLAGIGVVLNRVDVLVLGGLGGQNEVGPYFAAIQIATLGSFGLQAVNTILAPMIAERYAAGDHTGLAMLVRRAAWVTFGITAAASIGIALLGRWILTLFGSEFGVAYVPLLVVLAGQCVNASVGPVGYLMTMTRFERQAPLVFGCGALLNILLGVLLVPKFGMLGAAIATATATVAWNLCALIFVRKRLGITPSVFQWGH